MTTAFSDTGSLQQWFLTAWRTFKAHAHGLLPLDMVWLPWALASVILKNFPIGLTPSGAGVLWYLLNGLVGGQWLLDPDRPPKSPRIPRSPSSVGRWGELGGTKAGLRPAAGNQRMVQAWCAEASLILPNLKKDRVFCAHSGPMSKPTFTAVYWNCMAGAGASPLSDCELQGAGLPAPGTRWG